MLVPNAFLSHVYHHLYSCISTNKVITQIYARNEEKESLHRILPCHQALSEP